ncbi:MAG: hypothetical protein KAI57_03960 [Candidatus Pacebacteria bacterium]|nr:hypothetical protein [Candidatus Paceibacterota bacterium]
MSLKENIIENKQGDVYYERRKGLVAMAIQHSLRIVILQGRLPTASE